MKTRMWLGVVACVLAACGDDTPEENGAGGSGGSGARGGSGGAPGGGGGLAGMAGAMAGDPDAAAPRFVATLQESRIDVTSTEPTYIRQCAKNTELLVRSGDDWVPALDQRPVDPDLAGAVDGYLRHYLNGQLDRPCQFGYCDVFSCVEGSGAIFSQPAFEYVQMGQRAFPGCGVLDAGVPGDAGLDAGSDAGGTGGVPLIPDLRRVVPSGPLAVRVHFFDRASCDEPRTAIVPVE